MDKMDGGRLGSHLRRLRLERKLSLGAVESLSTQYGERVNKSYLFRVESGKILPTISRLRVLGKVYRVKLATLLEVLEDALEEHERETVVGIEVANLQYDELQTMGREAKRDGDFAKATLLFRAARDKAMREDPSADRSCRIAMARHDLSIVLKEAGRLDLAREEAETSIEIEDIPEPILDKIRLNLAELYRKLGRSRLAQEILFGLLARKDDVSKEILGGTHWVMGSVLLRNRPEEAARHYRSTLSIVRLRKDPFDECRILYNIGLAESKAGNHGRAMKTLTRARELSVRKDYNFWIAKIQTEIAKTHYLRGESAQARAALREANELARPRDYWEQLFLNQYYLRRLALDAADEGSAKAAEASMKYFATRLEESFEELEAFKEEMK